MFKSPAKRAASAEARRVAAKLSNDAITYHHGETAAKIIHRAIARFGLSESHADSVVADTLRHERGRRRRRKR